MRVNINFPQRLFAALVLTGAFASNASWAQTFNSGSTGSDGALSFPNALPGQTVIFDPTQFTPPLDPAHDNIFNFTTITIPKGVTIRLSAQNLGGPLYWLASGAVDVEGTLDLSGGAGYPPANLISQRVPSIAGAGGFPGGVGGNGGPGSTYPVEPGQGPAGGVICPNNTAATAGGGFTGNLFLVPLVGGSGGGGIGTNYTATTFGAGGGAGGGAILIASSVSITINGSITAAGGNGGQNGGYSSGGAGGAIHLMAPTILGNGSISVRAGLGGGACITSPQSGLLRLEAFNQSFSGSISGGQASGTPYKTFVPNAGSTPVLTVASVNGIPVAPNPLGNFTNPDVTFSASGAVPVVINGANIPVGTQVNLQIYSENGPDIVLPNAGALAGSPASSTVTVMVNLPPGFSRGFISASFTPQGNGQQNVKTKR